MRRIGVLVFFLSFFSLGYAQNEWVAKYNEAQQAYANDDLENALALGKTCLQNYLQQSGEINSNYQSILRLLSTAAFSLSDFESGIEYAQKELQVLEQMAAPKDMTYAGTLYNLGVMYQQTQQNEEAEKRLNETLEIYKLYLSPSDEEVVKCQWVLASVYLNKGELEKSEQLFNNAFEAYDTSEDVTMEYVEASYYFGNLLLEKGDKEKGIAYLNTVKTIYEESGFEDSQEYLNVVLAMANAYRSINPNETEAFYALAASKFSAFGDNQSPEYVNMLNNRAVNLQALGRGAEAESMLAALRGAAENGASTDISSLNNLAAMSQQKGDYAKAEEFYLQALEAVEEEKSESHVDVLENLALLYAATSRLDMAHANLEKSSAIVLELFGENHIKYASTLRKQAQVERELNNYEKSEEFYKKSIAIAGAGDSQLALQAMNGLAVLYKELGRYVEADSLFDITVVKAKEQAGDQRFYALVLNNQAALKEIKGEHFEARNLLQESLGVNEALGATSGATYLGTLENLSAIYIELGEYENAKSILEKTRQLIEQNLGKQSGYYIANVLNFGRMEQAMGQYPKAEPYFKEALELTKKNFGDQHPEYARACNAMALFYQVLGNNIEAEPLFVQSASIYDRVYGKSHPEYITTIENLSSLYQMQGENEKAMPLLQEALKMDAVVYGEEHPVYATTLHNLASLYQRLDRNDEAEPLFVKALEIDKRVYGTHHRSYANTLYNLGTLYQDLGKYDEAEQAYKQALEIRRSILGENHPDYAYSLYGLATLYHGTQKLNDAYGYYVQVIQKYTDQIDEYFPSMSEKEKSAFYGKIRPVFDAFFDFCIEYQLFDKRSSEVSPIEEMYNLQLATKALLLNASNKVRNRILSSGDQELIRTYRDWISMKEQLVKYFNYTQEELQEQQIDIDKLRDEANQLEKLLSSKSELFSDQMEKQRISWRNVKDALKDNEAAIEIIRVHKYFKKDSVLYAGLIVHKNNTTQPDFVLLREGNQLEGRLFNYYRNSIKFSMGNEKSYNDYWSLLDGKLEGVTTVYLSADGIYNKINVNTLWDAKTGQSVIDELEVRLVSNTRELVEDNPYMPTGSNIADIFGFPDFNYGLASAVETETSQERTTTYGFRQGISSLPGTKVEVENIEKMLVDNQWKHNVNMELNAREEIFKDIKSPRLLHIATHGFFMNDMSFDDRAQSYETSHNDLNSNPLLRSGILLTGSAKAIMTGQRDLAEDGIVTAYEAMNLDLDNTELVVLSACETGLGEVRNGEGVYGLQRSFIVAGARNVIMSLWKVDDQTTQELMSEFYSRWLAGMDKAQAFNEAQLVIKEKYKNPYYWGAFVMLGK